MIADILVFSAVWGAIYAVLALGFSVIYGVARILNLSHGAFYMAASYLIYVAVASLRWPFIAAAAGALFLVAGYGMALYRGVVQPMRASHTRVLVASAAWRPIRTCGAKPWVLRCAASPRWTSMAHAIAERASGNATKKPSPAWSISSPPWSSKHARSA